MNRTLAGFLLIGVFLLIDLYVYQAIRFLFRSSSEATQRTVGWAFWGFSALSVGTYLVLQLVPADAMGRITRTMLTIAVMIAYFSKFITVILLFIGDVARFFAWIWTQLVGGTFGPSKTPHTETPGAGVSTLR